MSAVANKAGVSRESIYRMLSKTGNPTQSNLRGILKALNLKLSVEAAGTALETPRSPSGSRGRMKASGRQGR
jgi:transcriptional regulator with XRE-family HTH domain